MFSDAFSGFSSKPWMIAWRSPIFLRMKFFLIFLLALGLPVHAQLGERIVAAGREQVGVTVTYDPAYVTLKYPGGDVAADRGVCSDVVIRALRKAMPLDLQAKVHEDMAANFSAYPQNWGLKRTDKNIDHRRVPNLRAWFKRKGWQLPLPTAEDVAKFQAGDLVTCTVPPNLPHIMIVSDKKSATGRPLVIHNIGGGAQEEDRLGDFPLTGLYRPK
jgi:uncharacterized protein YijF (DUF1287 family)